MKTIKILLMLLSFTLMSTGCRHDHHSHTENSSKTQQSNHPHKTEKEGDRHRH